MKKRVMTTNDLKADKKYRDIDYPKHKLIYTGRTTTKGLSEFYYVIKREKRTIFYNKWEIRYLEYKV